MKVKSGNQHIVQCTKLRLFLTNVPDLSREHKNGICIFLCLSITGILPATSYLQYQSQDNYNWNISGVKITTDESSADNSTTVTWNDPGTRGICVTNENANRCAASSDGSLAVTGLTQHLFSVSNN